MTVKRCSLDRQAGFTLIEVLVALVVTAAVVAVSGHALRVVTLTAGRGIDAINRLDTITRGISVLRRDLTRLERIVEGEPGKTRFAFVGTRQQLSFALVEPGFPTEPGTYWITYSVRKTKGLNQLVRSREPYEREGRRDKRGGEESVVVLEGPYDLAFMFEERTAARPRWVPAWTDA